MHHSLLAVRNFSWKKMKTSTSISNSSVYTLGFTENVETLWLLLFNYHASKIRDWRL
jgi:hypothetical protein